ncbi:histone deacetylase HDT2-like isoform X2 [Typha angustifolia]|uniref:histone deacetylase HDT2-like isoform X2 n=1 Tax=Typha angustifolia TaxID=59011 RepID=UPI003C2EF598
MEFWGVEVKPGETVKCEPGMDRYLHLSQASLGETKKDKGNENVPVFVKFNNQKLVLGTLSMEKCAQIQYDLVFEKEFELSHSSKNTSVHFCGYKTIVAEDNEPSDFSDTDSEEEEIPLDLKSNGKPGEKDEKKKAAAAKDNAANADMAATKPKAKVGKPIKSDEQESDEDDDEESGEDESEGDEDMIEAEDDSDDEDEDDSSDDEDEEATPTPKKAGAGNKRPAGSASKTPLPEKKAKLVSPAGQKTGGDGKKGGHTATPHPAKQAGKTPANNDKSKQQTPKSGGSVTCKSCTKSFNSENALQAHSKAKHSAAK